MTSNVIAFIFLVSLEVSIQQDGLICDMSSNTSRLTSCPDGFCCARDQYLASYVYCKRLGTLSHRCTTVTSLAHCPCGPGLHCLPDVVRGSYKSIYGTCQNFSVVASTTPTTEMPTTTATGQPTISVVTEMVSTKVSTSTSSSDKTHPTHPSTKPHRHTTKKTHGNIDPVVG